MVVLVVMFGVVFGGVFDVGGVSGFIVVLGVDGVGGFGIVVAVGVFGGIIGDVLVVFGGFGGVFFLALLLVVIR